MNNFAEIKIKGLEGWIEVSKTKDEIIEQYQKIIEDLKKH